MGLQDADAMRVALSLAERGRFTARPNPMVGAVVARAGQIIGTGYHERPGSGHAEVEALRHLSRDEARGTTVYVNLEPCSFTGRTPPCADLLVEREIGRVVCAMEDPDERVQGRGFQRLRNAGIDVGVGLLSAEAERLNAAYLTHRRLGRPFVTLKTAQSLDGSTAARTGDSKWITGPEARRRGHALRAEAQAIVVGIDTVLADDPELTVRHVEGHDPVRVVFDSRLRTPAKARVLRDGRCIVVGHESAPEHQAQVLEEAGAEVWRLPGENGRPDPKVAARRLAEADVIHTLIEGGSQLAASFVRASLVDRVVAFTAPKLLGGQPTLADFGLDRVADAVSLSGWRIDRVGDDVMLTANVNRKGDV